MSRMINKCAYRIFESNKATFMRNGEKIEPALEPIIIISIAPFSLFFSAMHGKVYMQEVI